MQHHDRLQAVKQGTDYQAPLRAINENVEGIVHCGLIVRHHEEGCPLTPEVRALDAIGTQVERELRQRAEMIRALVERCNVLEAFIRDARAKGYLTDLEVLDSVQSGRDGAIMPEQRRTLVQDMPSVAG
jgi:hypothetical protein